MDTTLRSQFNSCRIGIKPNTNPNDSFLGLNLKIKVQRRLDIKVSTSQGVIDMNASQTQQIRHTSWIGRLGVVWIRKFLPSASGPTRQVLIFFPEIRQASIETNKPKHRIRYKSDYRGINIQNLKRKFERKKVGYTLPVRIYIIYYAY